MWVFTEVLGLCRRLCKARGKAFIASVSVTVIAVRTRAYTVILAVEERTRDSHGLSALKSLGGLANW